MEFSLKIKDLKRVKIATANFSYYLRVVFEDEECEVTRCCNLLQQEGYFKINTKERIVFLEVWHYDSQKKIGQFEVSNIRFKNSS